jgi:hypothetical protein
VIANYILIWKLCYWGFLVDVKSQKCLVGEDILTDGFTVGLLVVLDSSNMTMDDWVQIAKDIKSSYNLYDG